MNENKIRVGPRGRWVNIPSGWTRVQPSEKMQKDDLVCNVYTRDFEAIDDDDQGIEADAYDLVIRKMPDGQRTRTFSAEIMSTTKSNGQKRSLAEVASIVDDINAMIGKNELLGPVDPKDMSVIPKSPAFKVNRVRLDDDKAILVGETLDNKAGYKLKEDIDNDRVVFRVKGITVEDQLCFLGITCLHKTNTEVATHG